MNYYNLVAGLPELQLEDSKGTPSLIEFKAELLQILSKNDAELLLLLFSAYDNKNFLKFIADKDAVLDARGNLTSEDWSQLLNTLKEGEKLKDNIFLPYIKEYFDANHAEEIEAKGISHDDYLSSLYYNFALKSGNKFLNSWFEFNLNLNNILTALISRKYRFELSKVIIGDNEVATTIRQSHTRDFGVSQIFEQFEVVMRISEEPNLLEREKKLEALKWNWLEENTFFNYFSVEKVLAYVLKLEIIERWKPLNVEKGTQIFRELLVGLKEEVKFETSN